MIIKRTTGLVLIAVLITFHLSYVTSSQIFAQGDAVSMLRRIEEELKSGIPLNGPIAEVEFIMPEGFPSEVVQRLWLFVAQLGSKGYSGPEISKAIRDANETLKLPAKIEYQLKNYTVIPDYERAWVELKSDGSLVVDIPYKAIDFLGNSVSIHSTSYKGNGTALFHIIKRYPKVRTYLVRELNPESCVFTFYDLRTGQIFNRTASMKIGLFSQKPEELFGWQFEVATVAVLGHFEEVRRVVQTQVGEFNVLFPAYDPLVVDTSISSANIRVGDTLTISAQIRNPQEVKDFQVLLGAMPSDNEAFEFNAEPTAVSFHSGSCPPIYLHAKAKKVGTYTITIYVGKASPQDLDVLFANGQKSVTYTIYVAPQLPKPPNLRIDLSAQVLAKFVNLTIVLLNNGEQKAQNVELLVRGDIDERQVNISSVNKIWMETITTKLHAPISKINVTVVYYDEDGKKYMNSAFTTVSTTNFVVPEEWRNYVLVVRGHEETKSVFIPGYQGTAQLKFYTMAAGPDFNGIGGDTLTFIPMSRDGFAGMIQNASLKDLGALYNASIDYVLLDIKPTFSREMIMREDEVKHLFGIDESEPKKLDLSKVPSNYEVKLILEEVLKQGETIEVDELSYNWISQNNWEDDCFKYEDTKETRWDFNKTSRAIAHSDGIELVYHPLTYTGGNLVKGIVVRNYAPIEIGYVLEIHGMASQLPGATMDRSELRVHPSNCIQLSLVQLSELDFSFLSLRLKFGDRTVAALDVRPAEGELPQFWAGFWDALKGRMPGILISSGLILLISCTTGGTGAVLYLSAGASIAAFFLHYVRGSKNEIQEIASAMWLSDYYGKMSDYLNAIGDELEGDGMKILATISHQRAKSIKKAADSLFMDTAFDIILQATPTDLFIALGMEEASEYRRGYAVGSIAGAVLSCVAYVGTYYLSTKLSKLKPMAKPLDMLKGALYNWVTPAIYDLVEILIRNIGIKEGAAILAGLSVHMAKAIIWELMSKDFQEHLTRISDPNDLVRQSDLFDKIRKLDASELVKSQLYDVIAKMENKDFEMKYCEDIISTWNLIKNNDEDTYRSMLEFAGFVASHPKPIGEEVLGTLHKCIVNRDPAGLEFYERACGWIAKVTIGYSGYNRLQRVKATFEFVKGTLDSRLDESKLKKISDVLTNLLKTRDNEQAYKELLKLKYHLFDNIGLNSQKFDLALLDNCLNKWLKASSQKDAIVSYVSRDEQGHYDARSLVEVKWLDVDGERVIPVLASKATGDYTIRIPEDAASHLNLKDHDFVIFHNGIPKNGKIIVPVRAEVNGQIAISKWLNRLLRAIFSEDEKFSKYLDDKGEVRWDMLESNYVILRFSAYDSESGRVIPKMVALEATGGESVIVYLSEELSHKTVILSDFVITDVKAYFEGLGLKGRILDHVVNEYWKTVPYAKDEAEGLEEDIKGRCGERLIVEKFAKKDPNSIENVRYKHIFKSEYPGYGESIEIDIQLKDSLIQSKFWSKKTFENNLIHSPRTSKLFNELVKGLKKYQIAMRELGKKKVCLVFVGRIDDAMFNEGIWNVLDALKALGEEDTSWLVPVNGIENL